jgi:hypothetical protein
MQVGTSQSQIADIKRVTARAKPCVDRWNEVETSLAVHINHDQPIIISSEDSSNFHRTTAIPITDTSIMKDW